MNLRETLKYYPPVDPTPRERGAYQEARRLARELGLAFQPGEIEVHWWRRDQYEGRLGFTLHVGRPLPIFLCVGLSDAAEMVKVAAHELLHARERLDRRDGLDDYFSLDDYVKRRDECETRAQAFAEMVLASWRAQQRPRPTAIAR